MPALSRQVPGTEAAAASGPAYVVVVHEFTPDVASLPAKLIVTGRTYQPLRSGGRSAAAVTGCGALLSIFTTAVD